MNMLNISRTLSPAYVLSLCLAGCGGHKRNPGGGPFVPVDGAAPAPDGSLASSDQRLDVAYGWGDTAADAPGPAAEAGGETAGTLRPWPCPRGGGESVTAVIGRAGGELTLPRTVLGSGSAELKIEFPFGALAEDTQITLTALTDDAPPGITARSPVYRFDPASLVLLRRAAISLPRTARSGIIDPPTLIYWSDHGSGTFAPLPDSYANAGINHATITRFGLGFVGQAETAEGNDCIVPAAR